MTGTASYPLKDALPSPYSLAPEEAERFNRYRFILYNNEEQVGTGTHFTGGNYIQPWIELQPRVAFDPDNAEHQELFDALTAVLKPGSHVMVHYLQDEQTAKAITADVPPPTTPLGFLLWNAGCRWYKDWYFTEGWMEGDQKLQGNLPVDAENKKEREQEWRGTLEAFVNDETTYHRCRTRAEQLLSRMKQH